MGDESPELKVRLVADDEIAWYNALMAAHHSLGVAASGRVLRYVAEAGGVPLVLGTFGSAAWRVPARDEFIGWDPVQRAERLERVVSNQRLCVLPDAQEMPHAASRALARMLRRLPADYLAAFGVRLAAAESFTDPGTHAGTVYKACGFTQAGRTAGYGRSRGSAYYVRHGQPKAYWIRELVPGGIKALTAAFDSRPLTGRDGPDFNELNMSSDDGLLEYLAEVADYRMPKGIRHGLAAILTVIVVARLSGADSVLRVRAVRCLHAAGSAGPLRHPVQPETGPVPAAVPEDDQAGRPRRRRGRRRPAAVRLAPGRGRRRAAELAAHRRRRQDHARRP